MAHYAFLNENNIVTEVIVGNDEDTNSINWEEAYGNIRGQLCKRTSYNTLGGEHVNGGIPFRKNYAGIGYFYNETLDAFIPPKPHPSWILDEERCLWNPPVPYPNDGKFYTWDENIQNWIIKN